MKLKDCEASFGRLTFTLVPENTEEKEVLSSLLGDDRKVIVAIGKSKCGLGVMFKSEVPFRKVRMDEVFSFHSHC